MEPEGTLVLRREEVARLLGLAECTAAVEEAFRLQGEGRAPRPGVLGVPMGDGGFHVKAAALELDRPYFAAKVNANFAQNRARHGLPTIQGVIALFDGTTGYLLAVMDSIEVTVLRTGAATALAARLLARRDARVATICGCGSQGRVQLRALAMVRPIERVYAFDLDPDQARRFAEEMAAELAVAVTPVSDPAAALRQSDVCVTCTPSRRYYVRTADVPPGTFLAAVGADSAEKQELDPGLFRVARVVVDSLAQCAAIGDLHHALEAAVVSERDVHAEIGELVAGRKPGRQSDAEITLFDSTGTALQDVAAAAAVYRKAEAAGLGLRVPLAYARPGGGGPR
jgi:alanine dehydrogenase